MRRRIDHAPCGILTITTEGQIHYVNETLCQLLNRSKKDILGKHVETFMSVANRLMFHTHFYPYIQINGQVDELLMSLQCVDGHNIPVSISGKKHQIGDTVVVDCVCIPMTKRFDYEQELRNVRSRLEEVIQEKDKAYEELHVLNEEIIRLARTDELTGLANRRYANQWMDRELAHLSILEKFCVLILDIDHFKRINDSFGHAMGDVVLKKLAQKLEEVVEEKGLAGRYGGEEFIVALPNHSLVEASQLGEDLRISVTQLDQLPVPITISVGCAEYQMTDSRESLLSRADRALYYAKENGRNLLVKDTDVPTTFQLRG